MKKNYTSSLALLDRARDIIPGLTQTFSKGPQIYGTDKVPHFLSCAHGAVTSDVDGNEYIDFSMGLGSVILGHGDNRVAEAVNRQMLNGNSLSLMHPLEIEVAEQLLRLCPWAQMVRYGRNGTDVLTAAVRLARAATGRDLVAMAEGYGSGSSFAYHGWSDWSAAISPMNNGIPQQIRSLTVQFRFNDPQELSDLFHRDGDRIALVVAEGAKFHAPSAEFVHALNTIPRRFGAMLLIDEVANGLRLAPGGAHQRFGINPDLVAYAKGISNGVPLGALVGTKAAMEPLKDLLFTLTYGGETTGLAAANTVIDTYFSEKVFYQIEENGGRLLSSIKKSVEDAGLAGRILVQGTPARFQVCPVDDDGCRDDRTSKTLIRELAQRGVLSAGVINLAQAHRVVDIERASIAYREAMRALASEI